MWKPIPGYENIYEASDSGQIRTIKGKITTNKKYSKRVWKQRILKGSKKIRHRNGKIDYMVTLWKNGKPHKYLISRLIATTFHENLLNSNYTVNHIDGDTCNNAANNLEWLTIKENIQYGFKSGQYSNSCQTIVLKSENGGRIEFYSMSEASRFLNRNCGYVSNRHNNGYSTLIAKNKKVYNFEIF